MKYLTLLLISISTLAYSQDTTYTVTKPCVCNVIVQAGSSRLHELQDFMKEKGVNCAFSDKGIASLSYIEISRYNVAKETVEKYPNIKLKCKLSAHCNENGLKVQFAFQEGRPGTAVWINKLTTEGNDFARDVYAEWLPEIMKRACKE